MIELFPDNKQEPENKYNVESMTRHEIIIKIGDRKYEITGAKLKRLKDFSFILKLSHNGGNCLSEINLARPKSRYDFIQETKEYLYISEEVIKSDLFLLMEAIEVLQRENIEKLESERESIRKVYILSNTAEMKAIDFLCKRDILNECLLKDTEKFGYVGDEVGKKMLYVACTSRLLANPVSIISIANSSAGKSFAMESITGMMPDDEVYFFTRMSPKSLSHFRKYDLMNKVVIIDELGGIEEDSMYNVRSILSKGMLTAGYTSIDRQTGEMETLAKEIYGPISLITSTTHEELLDDETRNRFVILTVDESTEQTMRVMRKMVEQGTREGNLLMREKDIIQERYKAMQKVLRPMTVIIPDKWKDNITFKSDKISFKRKFKNYLSILNSIALHRQYQKKVHKEKDAQGKEFSYIYVDEQDIMDANELAKSVFKNSLGELNPVNQKLLADIKEYCKKEALFSDLSSSEIAFTRRDIREYANWEQRPLRRAFEALIELEYLLRDYGPNQRGQQYYKLAPERDDNLLRIDLWTPEK